MTTSTHPLAEFKPKHDWFVGVDSDGTTFNTMEIKHKKCFIPTTIEIWSLHPVAEYVRATAEFVNLYSKWRGLNRWPALVMVLDLLREQPEVIARNVKITEAKQVREFIASGQPLSSEGINAYVAEHPNPELDKAMAWNKGVNDTIAHIVHDVPPFPFVRESLDRLSTQADIVVVSQTPTEALVREWQENNLAKYARIIAGQEMGTKKQHLALAAKGKYPADHILMMGDALGDMEAAKANDALFFPINPGQEDKSWDHFHREGLQRFLNSTYKGDYEAELIREFEKLLPATPPWKK